MAENALAAGEDDFDPSPTAHLQGLGEGTGPLTAGEQGVGSEGTVRVAPADGCAERQSTTGPSPAASEGTGPTEEQT